MTPYQYLMFRRGLLRADANLGSVTLKLALLDNGHTPSVSGHDYYDDVSGDELAASGNYTTGGFALSGVSLVPDVGNNRCNLQANNISVASCTFTWRYGVLYVATGTPSTSLLVAYFDPGGDVTLSSQTFSVVWPAGVVLYA